MYTQNPGVRKARKESTILRALSTLLRELESDIPDLRTVYCTHVSLSGDSSLLFVYLHSKEGEKQVRAVIEQLKLYKPSLKASLSALLPLRRTPDIKFIYNDRQDKQDRIESLLDSVKQESSE